ncbi:poly(glycerol-phosphate) alpha-glucosyltransferase [Mycetocola miduiensis]|uniref:Poly(Glycerol-phosphate) alpha-glucosyltransferase n=1 Tax=Mycetocola miduiensis TaxID=995034 RepID=A0A1I5E074_9MICO|nr:poly(glycerol-phosphate) alpha-glucosyltransferase [Mycetocola miduiensis]
MPPVRLRPGCHLAVTWGIDDKFGGMTGALLHRSRAFVRLGEVQVDVVTFDLRPDYPALEQRLRASGELTDGMTLLNIWDWLREKTPPDDPDEAHAARRATFTPLSVDQADTSVRRDGRELMRIRRAGDGGTDLQVDHYRSDGTLAVSDRRDVHERGTPGGRVIVWCDAEGQPRRRWTSARSLYRWWLDQLRDGRPTTLIVDSKTSARFLAGYRRRGLLTFHVVHASHRQSSSDPLQVRASRADVFRSPEGFDRFVFLTERQLADARLVLGTHARLTVIPNGRDVSRDALDSLASDRDPYRGIVLASLDSRKRVEHAVQAVSSVPHAIRLDVFGEGPGRPKVERAVAKAAGSQARITLHGYRAGASRELAEASFLLLTSKSEGLPLVLVEAMANGCVPIAYDVPYGPADIIRSGHNGFLVPAGDVPALTAAIENLLALPAERVATLRRNAVRTAEQYSDDAVTRMWAREIERAATERGLPPTAPARALVFRLRRGIARRWRNLPGLRRLKPATTGRHR